MKNAFEFKTLTEFTDFFKDEETCIKHFASVRFANGEYCPHCGHEEIYTFSNGKRYRCAKCREDFTIKTGTVFGESKLPIKKWFIAIYLLSTTSKGISSVQLAKHVGVTQKTGWFMDHRIRKAMKQNGGQLFGTVEVDETFVGGKAKNMHKAVKARKNIKPGGASETITPVMGLLERGVKASQVTATVIKGRNATELQGNIHKYVLTGSEVISDAHRGYAGLSDAYSHQVIDHAIEYVRGNVHTNGIESFWALFKRGYYGIYHQMSRKHLQRYVDEFTYRFNRRKEGMQTVFSDVVERVAESTKLPYKELIA